MFDFLSFAETHSVAATFLVLLSGLVVYWLVCIVRWVAAYFWGRHKEAQQSIFLQEKSIRTVDEKDIIYRRDVIDILQEILECQEQRCGTGKCPNLIAMEKAVESVRDDVKVTRHEIVELRKEVTVFKEEARVSRDNTRKSIESITEEVKTVAHELLSFSRSLLDIIRKDRGPKGTPSHT